MPSTWRYTLSRIWQPIAWLLGVFLVAALVFYEAERGPNEAVNSVWDALWYTLITVSTVGYGDMYPVTTAGRLTATLLVLLSLLGLGVLVGRIGEVIVEAQERRRLGLNGTDFGDHIVILGWSLVGDFALRELLQTTQRVAVVVKREELLYTLRNRHGERDNLFLIRGEPRTLESLRLAAVERARTVIIAGEDDTENLIVSINVARQNPEARLIVSISNQELAPTFEGAGVTYVSNPYDISGRLVASAAFEPEVARFVEEITRHREGLFDLQEFTLVGRFASVGALREASRREGGPLLLSVVRGVEDGEVSFETHPGDDARLGAGDRVIVLTNAAQAKVMERLLAGEG